MGGRLRGCCGADLWISTQRRSRNGTAPAASSQPSGRELEAAFARAGFGLLSSHTIEQPVAESPIDYLSKVRSRTYSDLAALSDEAFEAGVARMTAVVADGWRRSLREPRGLFAFQKA